MAVEVKHRVTLTASLDTAQQVLQFQRLAESLTTVQRSFDAEESGQLVLAASETGFALPLGKVSVGQILYIETDQELLISINGSGDLHKITPSSGKKAKLLWEGEFTSAPAIDNTSVTEEANVSFFIAGAKP